MADRLGMIIGENVAQEMVSMMKKLGPGCVVEVGVYKGGSAQLLSVGAVRQGREMFAYDTFEGIPYQGPNDSHRVGDFRNTSYEHVKANLPDVMLVKGIFPESSVPMPPVAFAHLDCDQYQSIKEAALFLEPLMIDGGIMWFDDYGCLDGANKAVEELYSGRIEFAPKCKKAFVRFINDSRESKDGLES